MNPYLIIGALIALMAVGAAGLAEGRHIGLVEQSQTDQKQFDAINAGLTAQKAQAAKLLADTNSENMAILKQRTDLQTQLEKAHVAAQIATDSLRTQLAGSSLRFASPESTGSGASGGSAKATGQSADSPAATAVIQLPDKITSDLRQLAYDADALKDSYTACYADDQVK